MSGHSKWHSIRHKKGLNDAKRGKVLTKHSKILMVVGRDNPNPDNNASLRTAIENAKADSVPRDNIERILKKLSGQDKDAAIFSEQVYEGFGPDGVPFIVTAITDKPNRTFPALRVAFQKNGGNLGSSGSVMFMFDRVGVIAVKSGGKSEDELLELVLESGAADLDFNEESSEVITKLEDLTKVRDFLSNAGLEVQKSELQFRANDPKIISDSALLERLEKFIDAVEESDDVDEVFGGFDVAEF